MSAISHKKKPPPSPLFEAGCISVTRGDFRFFIPTSVARQLASEEAEATRQREEAERIAQHEAAREKMRAAAEQLAQAEKAAQKTSSAELARAASLRVEVINNYYEVGDKFAEMTAPSDTSERTIKAALESVIKLGPDRTARIDRGWRKGLDRLRADFPSFGVAIDLVGNAIAVSEVASEPPRIRPMLLVGDPGLGKSYFCKKLARAIGTEMAWVPLDAANSSCTLRGTDKHWSTAAPGVLMDMIGTHNLANPVIVLDELDKAKAELLAPLYGCLEPTTASDIQDLATDVRLDTSHVIYIATANSLQHIPRPLLSRFEVVHIELPPPEQRRDVAARIIKSTIGDMGLSMHVRCTPGCAVVLEEYSPRIIARTTEKAAAAAIAAGRSLISDLDIERALGARQNAPRLH